MKKLITLVAIYFALTFTISAQVYSVDYLVEYNSSSDLYDCKIIIVEGEAMTVQERALFNTTYTLVVPSGTLLTIQETLNPLLDNIEYTGTNPIDWVIGRQQLSPLVTPLLDYYSMNPNFDSGPGFFNNINEEDTIKLFSVSVDLEPCDNSLRLFRNGEDPSSSMMPDGQDYSNGIDIGLIGQIYNQNRTTLYGPAEFHSPKLLCLGDTTFVDPGSEGTWLSDNPEVAFVGTQTGIITSLSEGTTFITFMDGETGCSRELEVNVSSSNQNVGIGTNCPLAPLNVLGSPADPMIPVNSSNGILRISAGTENNGLDIGKRSEGTFDSWFQAGHNGTADPISLNPLGGNVGIGTTSPTEKLHVDGNLKVAGIISGVSDPISPQDAATKAYVDSSNPSPIFSIGYSPDQGGYIFWISADGKHGLVASTTDQGSSTWYEAYNVISNPNNHSGEGDNFRDWRMPTRYELNEMYLQKDNIGGFNDENYWSATALNNDFAWVQYFMNSNQDNNSKNSNNNIRAVRSF